jgi:toxin ParE1/3/4
VAEPRHRVRSTIAATGDLTQIGLYIAADSIERALEWMDRLEANAARLGRFPDRGREVPELKAMGIRGYREIVVRPYRIVFRIAGRDVFVLAVIDGRRDLAEVLLERLIDTR